jgi:hypothetical protein
VEYQYIRPTYIELSALVLGAFRELGGREQLPGRAEIDTRYRGKAYHVESNDIFEGDLSGFVFLDEDLVDEDWT